MESYKPNEYKYKEETSTKKILIAILFVFVIYVLVSELLDSIPSYEIEVGTNEVQWPEGEVVLLFKDTEGNAFQTPIRFYHKDASGADMSLSLIIPITSDKVKQLKNDHFDFTDGKMYFRAHIRDIIRSISLKYNIIETYRDKRLKFKEEVREEIRSFLGASVVIIDDIVYSNSFLNRIADLNKAKNAKAEAYINLEREKLRIKLDPALAERTRLMLRANSMSNSKRDTTKGKQ